MTQNQASAASVGLPVTAWTFLTLEYLCCLQSNG